jgi:hypothetical protein
MLSCSLPFGAVLCCAADTCKQKLSSMPAALSCSAVLFVLTLRWGHYLRGSVPAKIALQGATRHMQQQPVLDGLGWVRFSPKLTPGCFPAKRLQVGLQWQGGKSGGSSSSKTHRGAPAHFLPRALPRSSAKGVSQLQTG